MTCDVLILRNFWTSQVIILIFQHVPQKPRAPNQLNTNKLTITTALKKTLCLKFPFRHLRREKIHARIAIGGHQIGAIQFGNTCAHATIV
jgi:hypothetical protein